jgi:hypothetical protein
MAHLLILQQEHGALAAIKQFGQHICELPFKHGAYREQDPESRIAA